MKQSSINNILRSMRKEGKLQNMKGKGDAGEEAALQIVLERQRHTGGLVYQSFQYPYQKSRQGVTYLGNIKLEDGQFVEYTESVSGRIFEDEIDILYVSPYRIIPIEVKSYHATLTVYNDWMDKQGVAVEKSPIAQAEKHARHLYHAIKEVLPDGRPEYIKPLVCFVDRCSLTDSRESASILYLPCCILNTLKQTIINCNSPLAYNLDMESIKNKLKEVCTNVKQEIV